MVPKLHGPFPGVSRATTFFRLHGHMLLASMILRNARLIRRQKQVALPYFRLFSRQPQFIVLVNVYHFLVIPRTLILPLNVKRGWYKIQMKEKQLR